MSTKTINAKIKTLNKPNKFIVPVSALNSDDEDNDSGKVNSKKTKKQHKKKVIKVKTDKNGTTKTTTTTTINTPTSQKESNDKTDSQDSQDSKDKTDSETSKDDKKTKDNDKDKIPIKKKKKKSRWKSHLFILILIVVIGSIIILSIQKENAILRGALSDLDKTKTTTERKPILSNWYFSFVSLAIGFSVGFFFIRFFGKKTREIVEDKVIGAIDDLQGKQTLDVGKISNEQGNIDDVI